MDHLLVRRILYRRYLEDPLHPLSSKQNSLTLKGVRHNSDQSDLFLLHNRVEQEVEQQRSDTEAEYVAKRLPRPQLKPEWVA